MQKERHPEKSFFLLFRIALSHIIIEEMMSPKRVFSEKNCILRMLVGRKEILQLSLNQEDGENLKTFK